MIAPGDTKSHFSERRTGARGAHGLPSDPLSLLVLLTQPPLITGGCN